MAAQQLVGKMPEAAERFRLQEAPSMLGVVAWPNKLKLIAIPDGPSQRRPLRTSCRLSCLPADTGSPVPPSDERQAAMLAPEVLRGPGLVSAAWDSRSGT